MKTSLILMIFITFSIACNAVTPQEDAFRHVTSAKANVRSTIAFLNEHIKTEKYEDVLNRLTGCLQAYEANKPGIEISLAGLNTPQGRADAIEKMDLMVEELSYDCEWQFLVHNPPVVKELHERVERFEGEVDAAIGILRSIHQ